MPIRPVRRVLTAVVGIALAHAPALDAQAPITLEEAIALARERGPQARAAVAARDAARYRHRAFASGLLPQLSLAGTVPAYDRAIVKAPQPDGSTLFRPKQQTNADLSLRLSQRLPVTGGELFASSSLERLSVVGEDTIKKKWSSAPGSGGIR